MGDFIHAKKINFFFAFFVFLTMNLPSVKLFYSSSMINMVALAGLWLVGMFRASLSKNKLLTVSHHQFNFLMSFILLWAMLFWVTTILKPLNFGVRNIFQYASVILFTLGIVGFVQKQDFKYIFWIQVCWGIFIAYLEMNGGITKDLSLGQNYLTTGVTIANTIILICGYLFSIENKKKNKIFLLPVLLLLLRGVTSLSGRAPILFSIAVPLIVLTMNMLFERNKLKKTLYFVLIPVLFIILLYIMIQNLPDSTIDRIFRIFTSIQDEPRYAQYIKSVDIIWNNPFGIGLTGQSKYGMNYPHNIFLELMMAGGIFAIIPLILIFMVLGNRMKRTVKRLDNSVIWMSSLLYFFFTWNISFDLSSSYMLFSSIALYAVSSSDRITVSMEEPILDKLESSI